ncbi:hypothetical protein COUCH_35895 [Couchioplanes caeruleus]|uniref:hypothetical protein n=1 Tax=Couchioplanes caeruleus TaxID=56438 RepID=UPI0020C11E7B|nr:hypothetical protein [Couchioplanes caeruleus]UQU64284.1 hypothetical protein COUCH_35895 [Couchioplanes caeruleus]
MHTSDEQLHHLLERELRAAVAARIEDGAEAGEVTADLVRRLRRISELRSGPPGPRGDRSSGAG